MSCRSCREIAERLASADAWIARLHRKAKAAFEQQQPMKAVEVYEVMVLLRELLGQPR